MVNRHSINRSEFRFAELKFKTDILWPSLVVAVGKAVALLSEDLSLNHIEGDFETDIID